MLGKINFNVLYCVNSLLTTHEAYVELYKDKKEYYLYCSVSNKTNLFFKINRYDLINLIRKKIDMVTLIEKIFDSHDGIFKKVDNHKSISFENLIELEWVEIKKVLDDFDSEHRFFEYAAHLEKKLNGKLRKDKIKNLFNE